MRPTLLLVCLSMGLPGCLCCGRRAEQNDVTNCPASRPCSHCQCAACRLNRFSIGRLGCSGRCTAQICRTRPGDYVEDVDRAHVRQTARTMARRNLRRIITQQSNPLSVHFCGGFEQAYVDLAEGLPPQMPSRRGLAMTAPFRLLTGDHISTREWFTGYDLGIGMARQDGLVDLSGESSMDDSQFADG